MKNKIKCLLIMFVMLFGVASCGLAEEDSSTLEDANNPELFIDEPMACGFVDFYITEDKALNYDELLQTANSKQKSYQCFVASKTSYINTDKGFDTSTSYNFYCTEWVDKVNKYNAPNPYITSILNVEADIIVSSVENYRRYIYILFHDFVNDTYFTGGLIDTTEFATGSTSGIKYSQSVIRNSKDGSQSIYYAANIKINYIKNGKRIKNYEIIEYDKNLQQIKSTIQNNPYTEEEYIKYETLPNCEYVEVKELYDEYKLVAGEKVMELVNENAYDIKYYRRNNTYQSHKLLLVDSEAKNSNITMLRISFTKAE